MFFTFAGEVVSRHSKLQNGVALSTIEADFIVGVEAGKEILWMKQIIIDLGLKKKDFVVKLAKNPSIHSRTNHIGEKFRKLPNKILAFLPGLYDENALSEGRIDFLYV